MRVLHHYQLSASARFIRLVLAERGLVFLPKIEIPWERNDAFLSLNPAGEVPVLVAEDGLANPSSATKTGTSPAGFSDKNASLRSQGISIFGRNTNPRSAKTRRINRAEADS